MSFLLNYLSWWMGKILQLLLKQNIIPRCWKFLMNKGFRIWSKSSDFGPGTLRNMSLFWHDLVTEDALMVQTLIMPAAICHRLHFWEDCIWGEVKWQNIYLFHQALQRFVFLSFSVSAFTSLASTLERQDMKHLLLSKSFILQRIFIQAAEQYLHLQGLHLC